MNWMCTTACVLVGCFGLPVDAATDDAGAVVDATTDDAGAWLEWRGPLHTGVAPSADPPTEWHEGRNIRWKAEILGLGHSSPIVTKDKVFVTTAVAYGPQRSPVPVIAPGAHDNNDVTQRFKFKVICFNRVDGTVLWETTVNDLLPHEGGHDTGSLASASPISDGTNLYVDFGSNGLFALDFKGKILWQRQPEKPFTTKHAHGEGASPALADGILVINRDHEGQSFIEAIDAATGRTKWKKDRREVTSWASPLIVRHGDRFQVVVAGTDRIRAYDLTSGEVVWQCGGLSANVAATPVASNGVLVAASSYDTRAMLAIDLNSGTGDITGSKHVLWSTTQRTPYVPSMLVVDDHVYFLRHYQNILSRLNIHTGEESAGPFRLYGLRDIYASPVAAKGRIYITDLSGCTVVFTVGDQPEMLARNLLDDQFAATPAIAGKQLFLRGRKFLYCIEGQSTDSP